MKVSCGTRAVRLASCAGLAVAAMATGALAGDATQLMFPLNAGYSVVPFSANGAQGSGPASPADPLQRNDDDFAGPFALGFNFNIYGQTFTEVFINNNGNLTFGNGDTGFTPFAFPAAGAPRIAPFFGDVDTRNDASGVVYFRQEANRFVVTWDNVGYYNSQADRTNTFQVAISDGTDPAMGIGNNVCFSYDDMNWTTGSASGGVGGFGGSDATVGVNAGDGVNFFAIGRFDRAGNTYNGPNAQDSGIDFLDGLDTCFSVALGQNQPPICINAPAGNTYTLNPYMGDVLADVLQFIGPEFADIVTLTGITDFQNAQADGLVLTPSGPGNPALLGLNWIPGIALDGNVYNLRIDFMDNFGNLNFQNLTIRIVPTPSAAAMLGLGGLAALRRRRRA
ncbi:MAG: nidogen-like domain-containing protein [Phycisphaerales bacterium]